MLKARWTICSTNIHADSFPVALISKRYALKRQLRSIVAIMIVLFIGSVERSIRADASEFTIDVVAQGCEANTSIRGIAFSPDNQYVLTSWNLGESRLWDIKTGKAVKTWTQPPEQHAIDSVGFSPDGKSALTATDTNVTIWDVATGNKQQTLNLTADNRDGVDAIFAADGKQVITGESDGARVWDSSTGNLIYFFPGRVDREHGKRLQVSSDGTYLVLEDAKPGVGVNLWNIPTRTKIRTFKFPADGAFAPDSKSLMVSNYANGQKDELYLLDISANQKLKDFPISTSLIKIVFSPDGRYFLGGHDVYDVELWDIRRTLRLHSFDFVPFLSYTFYPDSQWVLVLYTSSEDNQTLRMVVWDIPSNRTAREWSIPLGQFAATRSSLSNNGRYLGVAAGNTVRLIDAHTGEQIRQLC